jgi:hypothetical protein
MAGAALSRREMAHAIPPGVSPALLTGRLSTGRLVMFRLTGWTAVDAARAQTFLSAFSPGALAPLWIGVRGRGQTLSVIIGRKPGRSPHYWHGPGLELGARFTLDLLIHADMGPGGVLYRFGESEPWSSLSTASATGPEQIEWPECWSVGRAQGGPTDRPFLGTDLSVAAAIG